jgi:hypothetical protein
MIAVEKAGTKRLFVFFLLCAVILLASLLFLATDFDALKELSGITGHHISAIGGFVSRAELSAEAPAESWAAVLGLIEGTGGEVFLELGTDPVNYADLPSMYALSNDSKRIVIAGLEPLQDFSFSELGYASPEGFEHFFSLPAMQSLSASFSEEMGFTLNSTEITLRYLQTNSFGSGSFFYLMLGDYRGSPVFLSFEEENSTSFENSTVDYQMMLPSGNDYFIRVLGGGNISYEEPSPPAPSPGPSGSPGAPAETGPDTGEAVDVPEGEPKEPDEPFCYYSCTSWDRSLCQDTNLQFRSCICSCDACPGPKPLEMADCSHELDDDVYIDIPGIIREEPPVLSFRSLFAFGSILSIILFSVILLVVGFEIAGRLSYERRLVNIFLELKVYCENSIRASKKELAESLYSVLLQVNARMSQKNKKKYYMDVNSLRDSLNRLGKSREKNK